MTPTSAPVPIVCFGSSLTEGNPHAEMDKWPTRLQWHLDRSHPGAFKVYNRGIAGNTSANGLDRIEEAVLPLLPGHVISSFGINDCNVRPGRQTPRVGLAEFASNQREIIRLVRAAGGTPTLLAAHYLDPDVRPAPLRKYDQGNGQTYAENFREYHRTIRQMAQECACALIDMPALMLELGVKTADLVIDDGIHPTAEGNHFYAEQVYRQFSSRLG